MKLLLDTHSFIFFVNGDDQLSEKAKAAILDSDILKFLSIAAVWEIAIKVSLNKLELTKSISFLPELIESNGFILQEIEVADAILVSTLPYLHKDPFDRMMVAQARNNSFTVVTKDLFFAPYGIQTIW